MSNSTKYGTAMICMDGLYIGGVRKRMKREFDVSYVDLISQPGIVRVLSENSNPSRLELIKEMLKISLVNHDSRSIVIAAHHHCLGNPVPKKTQLEQLPIALETVKNFVRNLGFTNNEIQYGLLWINWRGLPEEVIIYPNGRIFTRTLVFVR